MLRREDEREPGDDRHESRGGAEDSADRPPCEPEADAHAAREQDVGDREDEAKPGREAVAVGELRVDIERDRIGGRWHGGHGVAHRGRSFL